MWAFLHLLKSATDFAFQGPHRRAVAGDVRKGYAPALSALSISAFSTLSILSGVIGPTSL